MQPDSSEGVLEPKSEEFKRILHVAEELRRKPTDADWLKIFSHIKVCDDSQKEWEETKERWNKQEKFF